MAAPPIKFNNIRPVSGSIPGIQTAGPDRNLFAGFNDLAAGYDEINRVLEEREKKQNVNMDALRGVEAEGTAALEAQKRVAGLDPSAHDYEEQVFAAHQEASAAAGEAANFATTEARDAYSLTSTANATNARIRAFDTKQKVAVNGALHAREELENIAKNAVRENPNSIDSIFEDFARKAAATDELLPDHIKKVRDEQLRDDMVLSRAEGLAEQGAFDQALDFLDSSAASGVDNAHVQQMKRRVKGIESQMRLEHLRDTMDQVGELNFLVSTGQAGPREIDAARDAGLFQGREGTEWQLRTAASNVAKSGNVAQRKLFASMEALSQGFGEQGDVDRVTEAMFEKKELETGESLTVDEKLEVSLRVTGQTGMVPSIAKNLMINGGRTSDPEKLAAVAGLQTQFNTANPYADTGASDRVEMVAGLIEVGEDPQTAAQLVLDGEQAGTTDQRKEDWKVFNKKTNWTKAVADVSQNLDENQVTPEVASAAERLSKEYAAVLGPEQGAAIGVKVAVRQFGPTQVFGRDKAQQFAPDLMLAERAPRNVYEPEEFSQFIERDLRTFLEAAKITPGVTEPGGDPWARPGAVQLFTDDKTRQEVRRGETPSYVVRIMDENGWPIPAINKRTGEFARYSLPSRTEFAQQTDLSGRQRRKKQKIAKISREHGATRKRRQEGNKTIEQLKGLPSTSGKF